jgi:hypothetical protein
MRAAFLLPALWSCASAAPAQTAILKIQGTQSTDAFGATNAVAPIGDVDGDQIADLVIGSWRDGTNGTQAGRAQVRSGRDGSLIREHFGSAAGDSFGFATSAPGDVDADGVPDYAVSAPQLVSWLVSGQGWVDVFSGQTGALLHHFAGTQTDSLFGATLGPVGDIDGDGHADVFLSAQWQDTVVADGGEAYIHSGATGTLLWSLAGDENLDQPGSDADSMGDLDQDGCDDFVIGNMNERWNGAERGQAQIISGKTGTVLLEVRGGVDDDFGFAVANAGDVDADGTVDFIVGSPNFYLPSDTPGEAAVYSGATGAMLHCLSGNDNRDSFGFCVDGVGDVDQDGHADFVVSFDEQADYDDFEFVGKCTVYSGRRGSILFELETGTLNDLFGSTCESMGDLDGDGLEEIVVGAPDSFTYGPPGPGTVYVYALRDCHASWSNYGAGWPGTLGIPSLTASNPPVLGEPITVDVGNSAGVATGALLFLAFAKGNTTTSAGGTLLVTPPWLAVPLALPAAGLALAGTLPSDILLCGLELDLQVLEADPGASHGISFTPGLELLLGG